MIAHILGKGGNGRCPNASAEAQKRARAEKNAKGTEKRERENSESETRSNDSDDRPKRTKRKLLTKVETSLKQSQLKVFRGIQVRRILKS